MATLIAGKPVNMNTLGVDLTVLSSSQSSWNSTLHGFTVAKADGSIVIHAEGIFLGAGVGAKPSSGTIVKLTVEYGAGNIAYAISGFAPRDLNIFIHEIKSLGPFTPFEALFTHADAITGSNKADILNGGNGLDAIDGRGGDDEINGGEDDDVISGGGGKDALDGGDGVDTALYTEKTASVVVRLDGSAEARVLVGGKHEDTIRNIENVSGGEGNDRLIGDSSVNVLHGNDGNDTLSGRNGADKLWGGAGLDLINGGGGDDALNGGDGRDELIGGSGADRLNGGAGSDVMTGGGGADTFYFDSAIGGAPNVDTITDFKAGVDKMLLFRSVFAEISQDEAVSGSFFAVGSAKDEDDHVIYKPGSGKLLYDADGRGVGDAVLFAQLDTHLQLTANDFIVA